MTANRRDIFKIAAVGAAAAGAGALSGCARLADVDKAITAKTLAEAEKLFQLTYTDKERAQILEDFDSDLEWLTALRKAELPNDLAPALVFDPRLPGKRIAPQKSEIALGGAYDAPLPADEVDIAFASVAQQGRWLRAKAITSARLTEIYLRRIEKHDPRLHAFITVTAERALAEADAADKDFSEGQDKGPLHGIPYALKDLADTKGIKTTWGAEPFKDRVPETDADVVRRLQRAGAVLLGKSACGAIAYGDQWFGARTRNPWNPDEGSSGSSAGSASAVAAGLASFAIGTETLGSIVSPSERCGTTGLRPTFGRVSRDGFMALCWSLDKVGPICRSVEDTALVLSEINGFDADDAGAGRVGFGYDGAAPIAGMTVGYVPEWFEKGDNVDRAALEALKSLGVTLSPFPWPKLDLTPLSKIVVVEAAAAFSDLTLSNRDDELAWQDKNAWPNTWRAARFVSAVDYVQVDRLRRRLMQSLSEAWTGFDALIGPHFAGGALLATNCSGHPQLALRAGFAETKTRDLWGDASKSAAKTFRTPRGISLWADIYEERKIIALGRALEAKLGVAGERPKGF
ncbi:MAG: amidase [Parvularculaceae bacterium]|nr:amidase [Parvularculaceae bacterium]